MISLGLLLATTLAAGPDPALMALEVSASERVSEIFTRAHRTAPVRDPALSLAARTVAQKLVLGPMTATEQSRALQTAISESGGWDPGPRALTISGNSTAAMVDLIDRQLSLTEQDADVQGVGVASSGARAVMLVVLAHRLADLQPFPRSLPVGSVATLNASLRAPLASPQLVITGPDGTAETDSRAVVEDRALSAKLTFGEAGHSTVEVVGKGPDGPHVAAIFSIDVGQAAPVVPEVLNEPAEPIAKAEAVLARINQVRARRGLPTLIDDHTLDVLSLEHAEDMATHHFFAHVSPTHGDLHQRLDGRYAYARAGENLGEASGALAAELAIESSPAHLETLLDTSFNRVGLALYPNHHPGGQTTLLLAEIFASVAPHLEDPSSAVTHELEGQRSQSGLGPLYRDSTLDGIAKRHLAFMLRSGEPGSVTEIEDEAATLEPELKSVAVDIFVASLPSDARKSKNLAAGDFNRIGVSAVEHSDERYGAGRLWICVIYATADL